MARVRLTALGMEHFTGALGKVKFVDGVSGDLTDAQAAVVGAVYPSNIVAANGTTVIRSASPAALAVEKSTTRVAPPRATEAPAQPRLDIEPVYAKTIDASAFTLTQSDAGYVLDFTGACVVTVPADLASDFYCAIRQGGEGQVEVIAGEGATVEEIDGLFKTEKRLALLVLARFPNGRFHLQGRTA